MSHIFYEITLVLVLATVLGMIAQRLKQPTILGYLATGLIVGPLGLLRLDNTEVLDAMAQLGIAFLLFLVGLEMNLSELKHVGRDVILIGAGQVVFTTLVGLAIAFGLGYGPLTALYVAIALTFSSTIIVVKLLSEKKALETLYGKITVGVLLVQDFIALGVLILLSGLRTAGEITLATIPWGELGLTFGKGTLFLVGALALGRWLVPPLFRFVGRSQEVLFLVSLSWGLGLAALVAHPAIGLTVEIGSFLAGLSLAKSIENHQIAGRVKSLRDFFIVMFFIVLGSKIILSHASAILAPTILLSLFVLIGNPVIVMLIMGALGYKSRTSFMTGVTVAQISEFSLIVVTLGNRIGHIGEEAVAMVTAVGIVTITLSSYLILYSDGLYRRFGRLFKVFEFRKGAAEDGRETHALRGHIVLIGCHRMGHNILRSIEELGKEFSVIDFNPLIIERLQRRGIKAVYGDAADPEIRERAAVQEARLVISTIPSLADSERLLAEIRAANPSAKIIVTAEDEAGAVRLYEAGADYVLLPHFIGGLQLARTIQEDSSLESLKRLKEQDLAVIMNQP